ncbi:hypothetical protein [Segetibacter koreensis]|uniref:hypothetical protein n=1 Tax=Segetibacter koreensis TaxID=398037 RepID=UPI000370A4F8|nr:hypothetical protein [Segetibacter koreensis]
MQITFIKTIDGSSIEFNRILYPLRYCVINKEPDSNGMKYFFRKGDTGEWKPDMDELPEWIKKIYHQVHQLILENEKDSVRG